MDPPTKTLCQNLGVLQKIGGGRGSGPPGGCALVTNDILECQIARKWYNIKNHWKYGCAPIAWRSEAAFSRLVIGGDGAPTKVLSAAAARLCCRRRRRQSTKIALFHYVLSSPISQHSVWSEIMSHTRPRPTPGHVHGCLKIDIRGHVAVTSRQWMHSQSTDTTRTGLRDLSRCRALSMSVHYRRRFRVFVVWPFAHARAACLCKISLKSDNRLLNAELWSKDDFKNGYRAPSWILKTYIWSRDCYP